MATAGNWTFTNNGRTYLLSGVFNITGDAFGVALFQSTSNLGTASTTYAALTNEVASANGYATGGVAVTLTLAGTTSVTASWSAAPSWTASASGITARYAVLYKTASDILAYCLLDSAPADVTVAAGNSLTVAASASGLFSLA